MYPPELLLPIIYAILSTGAFIVAMITLWFSHLKGPDIDLCNIPTFRIHEERFSGRVPDYIPGRLNFEPIQLIFTNNGSRAGVITEIIPSFVSSAEFRPFYNRIYFSARREWPERRRDSYSDLPVSIREGDNCVVKMELGLLLPHWKDHIRSEELPDIPNVRKVVEQSLELDKEDFINFLNFIRTRKSFGNLTLELVATTKKRFKTKLEKKKVISHIAIENKLEELEDYLIRCLGNWGLCRHTLNQFLQDIPRFLDQFIEILKSNQKQLGKPITTNRFYGLRDLEIEMRNLKGQGSETAKLVAKRENLEKVFEEISKRAKEFNYEVRIVGATKPDVEEKDIERLNTIRKELEQLHEKTIENLHKLKMKLRKELT